MTTVLIFSPTLESRYVNHELWEKIQHIDLQLIIDRLRFKYHWSQKRIKKAISEYQRFLYIAAVCEDSLSPTKEVDIVWHDHILHTKKYMEDCEKTFGYFVHHLPTPQLKVDCAGDNSDEGAISPSGCCWGPGVCQQESEKTLKSKLGGCSDCGSEFCEREDCTECYEDKTGLNTRKRKSVSFADIAPTFFLN